MISCMMPKKYFLIYFIEKQKKVLASPGIRTRADRVTAILSSRPHRFGYHASDFINIDIHLYAILALFEFILDFFSSHTVSPKTKTKQSDQNHQTI